MQTSSLLSELGRDTIKKYTHQEITKKGDSLKDLTGQDGRYVSHDKPATWSQRPTLQPPFTWRFAPMDTTDKVNCGRSPQREENTKRGDSR